MFDVKTVRAEIEAEAQENETATAKQAKPANNGTRFSHISRFSTPPENSTPFTGGEKNTETPETGTYKTDKSPSVGSVGPTSGPLKKLSPEKDSIPFTDHEIAEHKIGRLKLHDDKVFLRQRLLGTYGEKRLAIVNRYLEEWHKGANTESVGHRKENAGRFSANAWLRQLDIHSFTETNK